ncbi:MAG: hypothetical protein EOO26_12815 [Comamonadaceae bacterium]|nr:MAG: hypothetical protein EOO26_12815 [Comamonadaceae bacterium]
MQIVASILWQRLDAPGHDACRLERSDTAWQLDGAAVFRQADGQIAQLHYRVRCDRNWHTQWGTVRGWLGSRAIDLSVVRRADNHWTLNDAPVPDLAHCVDLDLGFTPATNLIQLRRLQLAAGEGASAPAAWLDLEEGGLTLLDQRYERRGEADYHYQADRFDYAAVLAVSPEGFVRDYPGLWLTVPEVA